MPVYVTSGNFWICPAEIDGTRADGEEILLDPNPTTVEYGRRMQYTIHESPGRSIKQWTNTNPAPKRWVWKNYGPLVPRYEEQYWTLYGFQEHILVNVNSGSAYVYLKEDTTDGLGYYNSGTVVHDWVRCRVLMVSRDVRDGGGNPVYATTEFLFTIDDDSFLTY